MDQKDLDEQELIEVFNEYAVKYGRKEALLLAKELAQSSGYFMESGE